MQYGMSNQNNTDMMNSTQREFNWEKFCALGMIAMCALGLIFPFAMQSYNHKTHDIKIHVCSVDSLPKDVVLSAADAVAVMTELEKKEIELEDRYNYVLQQRENEFRWQSYMSYVIGIIVAICGFFGYKSIRELKDDVSKMVSDSAEKETRKFLDEKLGEMVNRKVFEIMNGVYKSEATNVAIAQLKKELIVYFDDYFENMILEGNPKPIQKQEDNELKSNQMQDLEDNEDLGEMFNNSSKLS